jgi:phage repressor protein C with HTH and peptisase S24 domain
VNLAERIKKIRETFGLNQEQLASILGTSIGVPKALEQGKTMAIKPKYSIALASRFKLSKEWIENGKGEMRTNESDELLKDLAIISNSLNNDLLNIPYYEDIKASAGNGFINGECTPSYIQLLPNILPIKSTEIEAIRVSGDSMIETIDDGDIIFVDKNYTTLINGKIYVVLLGDEVYVKRIFKYPNNEKLILKSDNPVYPQFEAKKGEFEIIGKVVANMNIKEL